MKEETPRAIWDIQVTKYDKDIKFYKSLEDFHGEPGMSVGKEGNAQSREHDQRVCSKIVDEMFFQKKTRDTVDTLIKFRVIGEDETAYLRVMLGDELHTLKEAYYPHEVKHPFSGPGDPLELTDEKFKTLPVGERINDRVQRFKASIQEEFEKRKM